MKNSFLVLYLLQAIILTLFNSNAIADSISPVYLFSHGLAGSRNQAYLYTKTTEKNGEMITNKRYILDKPLVTFDYPDNTDRFWKVRRSVTTLGQESEIAELQYHYQTIVDKSETEEPHIVIFGISRGASAVVSFLGTNECPAIKAAIVESPFDSFLTVQRHLAKRLFLHWVPGIQAICRGITKMVFPKYASDGLHPIDAVINIRKDLPILFICSKQDELVHYLCTVNLYHELRKAGHEHAYILILNHGAHGQLLHKEVGSAYQNVVHAFYQRYDLPHDGTLARYGKAKLAKCQPEFSHINFPF
jgi:hypothetical protein